MSRRSTWLVCTTLSRWPGIRVIAATLLLAACVEDPISPPATQVPLVEMATATSQRITAVLDAGWEHTCAVEPDRTVTCWGGNRGQTSEPLGEFDAVSAGGYHVCALSVDLAVTCWGDNQYGQTSVPAGLAKVTSMSLGGYHTCALTSDESITCWGNNHYGQISVSAGLTGVTAVATGSFHTCALAADATPVSCWGANHFGQTTIPVGLAGVAALSAGEQHTCALTTDGAVTCWGDNTYGQTNLPIGLASVGAVSAGAFHTCVVTTDGAVSCWGYNASGQTSVPAGLAGVTTVSAGRRHTCAVTTDGAVTCWGDPWLTDVPAGLNLVSQAGDTPVGTNVLVEPVDPLTGASPASLTFSNVTSSGQTTISRSEIGAPPPDGFRLGNPPVYYEIATTATFSGDVIVCIQYDATAFRNPSTLRLFHDAGGGWQDVTTSNDATVGRICGTVTSLSPFALFESAFEFAGFYAPVDNSPTVNRLKGGQAVPVKFSLGGDYGLSIFAQEFPAVQAASCDAATSTEVLEQTVTAGQSGLSYDAETSQYTYVWKTEKDWTGCRTLTLRFRDGQEETALFEFTK